MKGRRNLSTAVLFFALAGGAQAIQLGMLDDFEAGPMQCTTDNWTEGMFSSNPPTGELVCGEFNSCCLTDVSSGGLLPGSRQTVQNDSQWAGDYIAAGVNRVQLQAANASTAETLHLRVGATNGISCYVSTAAVDLAPDTPGPAGLQVIGFFLDETTMTSVVGNLCSVPDSDSLETVLSNVIQLRIISAVTATWNGDAIVSVLQIDAIQAKGDSDLDGVDDDIDNCTMSANPDQIDSDGDGFGNMCDADLNNDCIVNAADLGIFRSVFFSADADADFSGDGVVNPQDLGILRSLFFQVPGPGQGACDARTGPDAL